MISIYIPKLEDYWYEQKLLSDPNTMNYNAGYDVSYLEYHYDIGCIDFKESKWQEVYDKRINENRFFAYLRNNDTNEFVDYINYHFNKNDDRYECGIVIKDKHRGKGFSKDGLKLLCEKAKANGVESLYDSFEKDRNGINLFLNSGFKIVAETTWKKFNKDVVGIIIKKDL